MPDFKSLLGEVLSEQNKTFADLERANVICERSFYQYKDYTPYLPKIIEIANYLEISLDYLTGRTSENCFKPYKLPQVNFYNRLTGILNSYNISQSKFARDVKISRPNFSHWKNGKLPKLNTIVAIATYLNCSIDDLLESN